LSIEELDEHAGDVMMGKENADLLVMKWAAGMLRRSLGV